jgi:hypothetical protein
VIGSARIRVLACVPAACLLVVGAALLPPFSPEARAQAPGLAGVGETETIAIRATVKAVDMKTRTVTLVGPQGETKTLKVGDQVQNLAQVKPATPSSPVTTSPSTSGNEGS